MALPKKKIQLKDEDFEEVNKPQDPPTSAQDIKDAEDEKVTNVVEDNEPAQDTPAEEKPSGEGVGVNSEPLKEVDEGQKAVLDKMNNAEAHPERRDNFASKTNVPEQTTDQLDAEYQRALEKAPYLHSFLKNNSEPQEPQAYDQRKENALRWQQGITLLGKMAGIIGDTVTASKHGVVTDKKDQQGKVESDAISKQIQSLRDAYNAQYKTYLDAMSLYRKGKQAAMDADIKQASEYRNKLLGRKIEKEYSWDKGFNAENVAALRNRNRGLTSSGKIDPNLGHVILSDHRTAPIAKADMQRLVPFLIKDMFKDMRQALKDGKTTEDNGLIRMLFEHMNIPAYNVDVDGDQESWLRNLLNSNRITSAEQVLTQTMIKDAANGKFNYILADWLDETNNQVALDRIEDFSNALTGNQSHGWMYRGTADEMAKRKALADKIYNESTRFRQVPKTDRNGNPVKDENGNPVFETETVNENGYFTIPSSINLMGGMRTTFNTRADLESYINGLDRDLLYEICANNNIIRTPVETPTEQSSSNATEDNPSNDPPQNPPQSEDEVWEERKKNLPNILPSLTTKKRKDFIACHKDAMAKANGDKAKFAELIRKAYPKATDAEIDYAFKLNFN